MPASSEIEGSRRNVELLFRLGSVAGVSGAILALTGNALHPRVSASELDDPEAFLHLVDSSGGWTAAHMGIILASILFLGAQVAIYRSLVTGKGAAVARLGIASAMVGGAANLVVLAVDGIVMKEVARAWAEAPQAAEGAALQAAVAVYHLDFGLFSVMTGLLFFGTTFTLYGVAVLMSDAYPKWLGWIAVLGGAGSALVALVEVLTGISPVTFLILFPICAAALSIWMLIMGVTLWRKADALSRTQVGPPQP